MRNLKKILSLVLALMMVLSVMVTASAATYTDDSKIQYKEAVEVLSAAGIFSGAGNGEFLPGEALNREAAAKIIAYISEGGELDALTVDAINNPFTDVNNWAEPYVKYCASKGIIVGVGDGTFQPKGALNGYAFGKMLLITAGICTPDDFTGSDWKLTVATALKKNGILAGLENVTLSATMTREQAAQMAFNAMQAGGITTVLGYIVDGNKNLVFSTYLEAYLIAGSDASKVEPLTETTGNLLADNFGIKPGSRATDEFGRPVATVWENAKGQEIYSELATPIVIYKDATADAVIRTNLGLAKDADVSAIKTSNGNVVEVYQKNAKITSTDDLTIVPINYTVAAVAIAEADKDGNVVYTLGTTDYTDYSDAYLAKAENASLYDTVALHGEIADKALVTYTTDDYGIAHIYPTVSISGTLTAKNVKGTLTVSGTKLTVSDAAGSTAVSGYAINGQAAGFSLDQFGYVVGYTPVEAVAPVIPTEFVYVYATQAQGYVAAGSSSDLLGTTTSEGKDAVARAQVAFTDGTVGVIDLAITGKTVGNTTTYYYEKPAADGSVATVEVADQALATIGSWFAYTEKDGAYTLSAVAGNPFAAVLSADKSVTANTSALINGKYTTSATEVTAIDTAENKYNITTNTGLLKAGAELKAGKTLITYAANANTISSIYVVDYAIPTVAAPVVVTYYYAAAEGDQVINGTEWTFYVNGEAVTLAISGDTKPEAGKIYTLTAITTGANAGSYEIAGAVTATAPAEVVLADATFFVTDKLYTYNTNGYKVYNVSGENEGTADTIEKGDYVIVVAADGVASLIYIVDKPAG